MQFLLFTPNARRQTKFILNIADSNIFKISNFHNLILFGNFN